VGATGEAGTAGGVFCAVSSALPPTIAAAPASAPFWRNSRRSRPLCFDFFRPAIVTTSPTNCGESWRILPPRMMSRRGACLIAAVPAIVACASTGPSPATGLTGVVVRGPVTPVCRVDVPCDAPFSAGFTVQKSGQRVAQFQSDASGRFTVFLAPGPYTVVPNADAPIL